MPSAEHIRLPTTDDDPEPAVRLEAIRAQALSLELTGWVMGTGSDGLELHAEGEPDHLEALATWLAELPGAGAPERQAVKPEGHEQFAIRGVPAGAFVVLAIDGGGYELRLEVDGEMRTWWLAKAPSLDPVAKRFAKSGPTRPVDGDGTAEAWDHGRYERRGRVAWPEALERGHAMFRLHGEKLIGGFALQRTGSGWLLIKRRDEHARPGG